MGFLEPTTLPSGTSLHVASYPYTVLESPERLTFLGRRDVLVLEAAEANRTVVEFTGRLRRRFSGHPLALWMPTRDAESSDPRGSLGARIVIYGRYDGGRLISAAKVLDWPAVEAWLVTEVAPRSLRERGVLSALVELLRGVPRERIPGGGGA